MLTWWESEWSRVLGSIESCQFLTQLSFPYAFLILETSSSMDLQMPMLGER